MKEMDLNPVLAHPGGAVDRRCARGASIRRSAASRRPRYPHMAIHPYPVELEGEIALSDGTRLPLRPMRPEDAELELRFFGGAVGALALPALHAVPAASCRRGMLARFTQLDYDRELALVALRRGRVRRRRPLRAQSRTA